MSEPINALPDQNRDEAIGAPVSYSAQVGGDVRKSDFGGSPGMSDLNQDRPLAAYQVSTGNPDMPNGRSEMIGKNGVTGNIQQVGTPYAVGPQAENIKKSTQYLHDDTNDGPKANTL